MPGKVIGVQLGLGYPGSFSRMGDCIIQNRIAKGDVPFGAAVIINADNTVSVFGADNNANDFAGFAVREVKQESSFVSERGVYHDGEPTDILTRGSIMIEVKRGTPKANGEVYVRTAKSADFPKCNIGDIEAEADGTNTVLLTNVKFMTGQVDAEGVAEVTVLSRQA